MKTIYLIGSLRNPVVIDVGNSLREAGFDVFDDWMAAGPIADDSLRDYEKARGHSMDRALANYAAKHIFAFDKYHLDRSAAAILIMPAGKSGHLELGYMAGKGKLTYVLFDQEPERFDIMYQFTNGIFYNLDKLKKQLRKDISKLALRHGNVTWADAVRIIKKGRE